jgi:hypothetical protein
MTDPAAASSTQRLQLRSERLEFVNVEGEVVLLDASNSLYYFVNETGGRLWSALREGTTRDELVRLLREEHDVSEAQADTDISAFVEQLASAGLLDQAIAS